MTMLFQAKANRANGILIDKIYASFEKKMNEQLEAQPVQNLSANSLNNNFLTSKDDALKRVSL